ncbi:unnamed protein product (macronuclear) [Paramecium tetraurelia]|uniref:Uncharacterized protein n=1 Tax=Paramecium tetraurelia TaxID=5888 RepID=A0C9E6_PARTE|nr:uncharacterized protein GSPATT00006719001 [Paramecium tetraurelia]CAK67413.1 unnamed protein product [Paramecium tetraurelia]|eukprot:XP_001434810.1 hypothetical protein (macronuclear) [Paramecium tetraurelia strain d4-2]
MPLSKHQNFQKSFLNNRLQTEQNESFHNTNQQQNLITQGNIGNFNNENTNPNSNAQNIKNFIFSKIQQHTINQPQTSNFSNIQKNVQFNELQKLVQNQKLRPDKPDQEQTKVFSNTNNNISSLKQNIINQFRAVSPLTKR